MRILLVNYEYPDTTPNCGGGGQVTKQLKIGLENRGHHVRVLTDNAGAVDYWDVRGPHEGGHYATFPLRSKPLLKPNILWADVVHGHFSLPSSLLLPNYCERYDTPLVVSVMGADIYDPTRFGWLRPITQRLNKYILSRADRVVAPSTDMADRTHYQTGVEPDVIHYGIDPQEWEWREKQLAEPVQVLTLCRLVERKALRTAYEALQEVRRRGIQLEWHIVGAGPLSYLVEQWDIKRQWVSKHGYVEDLQSAYDMGDIFFLPSEHEAFGMVFLEAIACGLPVVTTQRGGQEDIMSADGYFDMPGILVDSTITATESAEGLEFLIEDYSTYQAKTKGYVEEHFSQEAMVAAYEQLYTEL